MADKNPNKLKKKKKERTIENIAIQPENEAEKNAVKKQLKKK